MALLFFLRFYACSVLDGYIFKCNLRTELEIIIYIISIYRVLLELTDVISISLKALHTLFWDLDSSLFLTGGGSDVLLSRVTTQVALVSGVRQQRFSTLVLSWSISSSYSTCRV